jgi:hypothetical protein
LVTNRLWNGTPIELMWLAKGLKSDLSLAPNSKEIAANHTRGGRRIFCALLKGGNDLKISGRGEWQKHNSTRSGSNASPLPKALNTPLSRNWEVEDDEYSLDRARFAQNV